MGPRHRNLDELIAQVRSQLKTRAVLRATAITLALALISLILAAVAADSLSEKTTALFVLRILPIVVTLVAAWLFLSRALRQKTSDARIALLVEEKCRLEDRLITAVEFAEDTRDASPAIVDRLVKDAGARSSSVNVESIVDPRYAYGYGTASCLILLLLVGLFVVRFSPISDGIAALYSPAGESVSANATFINVMPGTARVPRGSDQKIKAGLHGFDSNIAQVFVRRLDSDRWIGNPMEPAKNSSEFQFLIFNIQDSVAYYIEAAGIKSPEFTLEVADLPFVKQLDLVLDYPSYTGLPNKKIENGGEVAALKGTTVSVIARLNAGAKSARLVMNDGSRVEMSAGSENQFIGQFAIKQNGSYRVEITSEGGESYNGSNEYDITVLEDHPPTVSVDKPGRDMKVTSLQEIFTQARAEDDYGVASIELYYSVNGGEEKKVQLQDLKTDTPKALSGGHTFFLEEHALKPGDFISYYAKARDNGADGGHESTSDIYFLEVRPFDRNFRQAQQQGGGGGGGEQESSALTRRQREIIAATFRVQREQAQYTPPEKEENFDAVTLSQEKLKVDADQLAERIRRRLGEQLGSQPEFAQLVECLSQASKEMVAAIAELRARKTKEALPPEQRSLQQLLRAEAIFRDIQVAQGGAQGGGGGGSQNAQDLADLFELQLDKMKNQYETLQRQQQSSQDQQQDEISRRLQELARRQQQQVEQRMRSQMQGGGGGGGQSQRQQQEMIEEARRIARELERLSRDRRDPKLEDTARQLQQAADEMQRAQASSSSSSQSSSAQASAQSLRALEKVEQARRMLDQAGKSGNQQSIQRLRQQAEEALKRQEEIGRKVDEMARDAQGSQGSQSSQSGAASQQKKQELGERKQSLAEQLSGLEKDIDQTARGLGQDKQQTRDKLQAAAGGIRSNRIPDRVRQNNLVENGWYEQAREREGTIRGNIQEVLKNLQAAEGSGRAAGQADNLEEALNRARELADNLESLRRRAESQNGQNQGQQQGGQQQGQQQGGQQQGQQQGGQQQGQQQGGQQQGQQQGGQQQGQQQGGRQQGQQQGGRQQGQQQGGRQQGQQQGGQQQGQQQGGQQQGGQQQGGQQQGGQQQGQQQGGQQQGGQQQGGQQQGGQQQGGQQQSGQQSGRGQRESNSGGRATDVDEANRGGGPMRPGDRQLESEIRQRLSEAEELRKRLPRNSELLRDLNRAIEQLRKLDPNVFGDPNQLALLKSEVIDPLRQLELELARRLQAKLGNNGPGALSDGDAPDRYRKMIEDYYRRLSVRSAEGKP